MDVSASLKMLTLVHLLVFLAKRNKLNEAYVWSRSNKNASLPEPPTIPRPGLRSSSYTLRLQVASVRKKLAEGPHSAVGPVVECAPPCTSSRARLSVLKVALKTYLFRKGYSLSL